MTDEEFLLQLGKTISIARKAKGMSQTELSAAINMDQPNLSAIENGRQNASSLMLKRIADALGVEVKDFFS
jgi:transcriptional regulator with XRE-family HTH domain